MQKDFNMGAQVFKLFLVDWPIKVTHCSKINKIELWDLPQLIKLIGMNHNSTKVLVKP
jgi:hypothetical protein